MLKILEAVYFYVMRILVVKLSAIGDVIMALPFVSAVKERWPEGQLTWLCGKEVEPLLRAVESIDELLVVDEAKLLAQKQIGELFKVWKALFGRKFDQIFTFHSDPRYRLLSLSARSKDRRFWSRGSGRCHPLPGRYHAEECIQMLDQAEGAIERQLRFPAVQWPKTPLKRRTRVLLAPGGAKNSLADDALRRWPVTSYAEVAKELSREFDVVVVGGKSDAWVVPYFQGLSVEMKVGTLGLLELGAWMRQSDLVITHDSGPLHLAKLADCPAIALFGPTQPSEKVSPQEKVKVLWGGQRLSCRPCYNGKTYAKCSENRCLKEISAERVIEEARQMLQGVLR